MVRGTHLLKLVLALALGTLPMTGHAAGCRLAVLGDSLTAGYGVAEADAFPVRLEAALRAGGLDCTVINAGVSGDTSAGGRARLSWILADRPTHLLVELGANDILRGLPPAELESNLDAIVEQAQQAGVKVMLAGMLAPPNLGPDYQAAVEQAYARVAAERQVPLYRFFLDGLVGDRTVVQPDGLHPNATGVRRIVERITPPVKSWLVTSLGG